MTVQIAIRLDDGLAEDVKSAAAAAGTNLSDWVRAALARQVVAARALRARAEEDARGRHGPSRTGWYRRPPRHS